MKNMKLDRPALAVFYKHALFEGYASVFNTKDFDGDVICAGAFQKCLQRIDTASSLPLLWQHDPKHPIGYCQHLHEDRHGLWVKCHFLPTRLPFAAFALSEARARRSYSLSIGYIPVKTAREPLSSTRYLFEIDLKEISLVTHGSNPGAHIHWLSLS